MPTFTEDQVLKLLRTGTSEERVEFVSSLPPSGFKDAALGLIGSENPGIVVVALGSIIQEYCYGGNPEYGAILASAAHERALELWETDPNHGLLPTTLSGLASNHVKALSLLGRSEDVLEATERYINLYERLDEHENLPSLKVLRIEALVNLRRIDEAAEELQDESLLQHPIAGIEAGRLKGWVDRYRADPTSLRSQQDPAPQAPTSQEMLDIMKSAIGIGFEGEKGEELRKQLDRLDPTNRIDPNDPAQFEQLLETLGQAESFFTKGGDNSELTVRADIRNASAIFVHLTPEPDVIHSALAKLKSGLAWAKENGVTDLENDALWGIYLCRSRLEQPSEAADALIELRGNLESMRSGIADPLKRGGIFSAFPYLFNALCEQLKRANRVDDLLEAIESSKGRVIADRLTAQIGEVTEDSAIYGCVARLPDLAHREQFHYLTYFVDEERVYAVLVSKQGKIQAIDPIEITNHELHDSANDVDPGDWGQPRPWAPATRVQDVSARLAPLVAWLDGLLEQGIVEPGDHICYSSDDSFHNIPLQYLRLRDGIVIDWFSVSRVHSAFHLDRILGSEASEAPDRYIGFVVPLRQDLEEKDGQELVANLDAPPKWLESHERRGESVRLEEATLERMKREDFDHKLVHFSTHGWFPEKEGNPFHDSYLLLASVDGLPDKERVVGDDQAGKLTPSVILDSELDFTGSHVSMMACVSGLAKEGIGGDTLGLDWAFIQAGASSLISTHWEVSGAAAARFFTLFYEKWIEDAQPRISAFRDTMLELLEGDNTPNSLQQWTAFSLTGDFR